MSTGRHLLADWLRRRSARKAQRPAAVAPPPPAEVRSYSGEYALLHKYLRDRFADRVVLTFEEIEDLLGFPLPATARLQDDWWAAGGVSTQPSAQADSWISARRTAKVNLPAQNVLFERQT